MALTRRERLERTFDGEPVDRVAVALWRHFPVDDQEPEALAAAVAHFQRTYDFDFVKATPASSFCLRDWGVEDEWRGNPEGAREYVRRAVHSPDDWARLPRLDPTQGFLGAQLHCLRLLRQEFGEEVPVVQTIFSPLAQAKNLAGGAQLLVHLRRFPEVLKAGLRIIAQTTQDFVSEATRAGAAGIFYAVQHANYPLLSEAEYLEFGRPFDLMILDAVREATPRAWLNVLHLHGAEVMFDLFADYPVQVVNWHDRETAPSLAEGQARWRGAVCGGLRQWQTLAHGAPEAVRAEAAEAIAQTGGRRFILGTGCVTPIIAPHANLRAARRV